MNTKAKGNKAEKEAMDIYRREGFAVWSPGRGVRCVGPGRFVSTPNDVFGLFDFIATSDAETHWVQVKSTVSDACKARREIGRLKMPNGTVRIVMCRISGKRGWFKAWVMRENGVWVKSAVIENDFFKAGGEYVGAFGGVRCGTQ